MLSASEVVMASNSIALAEVPETKAKPATHLGVARIALGVFFGQTLFGLVAFVVYGFVVLHW
jgi:hypothetical protein